ncbi:MAG: hypothetical protein C0594_04470 [Marinilabiliales bacterium]|nr:MAG: hypothetical protein C0594_04470 [Marinilabiliales bacterium]
MNTNAIYERITATIMEMLEEHKQSNFTQSWYSLSGDIFARNIVSDHTYNGINQLLLSYIKHKRKYKYNRWLTFKQLEKYNARIKKGSKAAMVVYTSALYIDEETGANLTRTVEALLQRGQSIEHLNVKRVGYLKNYNVFSVDCVEGLPEEFYEIPELDKLSEIERDELADMIVNNTGINISYEAQNEAYYSPSKDRIYMPLPKQFVSKEAFYSCLFHELSHSVGHESRLNRPLNNRYASSEYGFEELVSELSSAYIMAYLGYESRITDNVDYINNWLSVMENDKKFVVQASSQAQAAADYILQTAEVEAAIA